MRMTSDDKKTGSPPNLTKLISHNKTKRNKAKNKPGPNHKVTLFTNTTQPI